MRERLRNVDCAQPPLGTMARVAGIVLASLAICSQAVSLNQFLTSPQYTGRQWSSSPDVYVNSWAVKIRGGSVVADVVARRNGLKNIGLVCRECLGVY